MPDIVLPPRPGASPPPVQRPAPSTERTKVEPEAPPVPDWAEPLSIVDPFARLEWLDRKLVAAGFPPMSPWWRSSLRTWYASRKTWGVYLVGRGGGKSTTLTRIATCDGLFTERRVPPGQRWIWPFVSVASTDARARIIEIQAILRAVGLDVEVRHVGNHPTIEALDAHGNPVAWKALAATIAGVSGPTTIGAHVDEEAKLRDTRTGANPAREIIASLIATSRARPGWRAIRCSSAWTSEGSHAAAVDEGDTAEVYLARIGRDGLDIARDGLLDVAKWEEQARRDLDAARTVRGYAVSLKADSAHVPTWLANPSNGAVRSREMMEATPASALDGLTRTACWLREYASVLPAATFASEWEAGPPAIEGRYASVDPRRHARPYHPPGYAGRTR